MNKDYFTSGEFAKLCGITKETLFHYDEMGIFEPAFIGENKYRYYSPKQFFDFNLIYTIKESGSSLSEIKEYMQDSSPEMYLELIRKNRVKLQQQLEKIEKLQRVLYNAENIINYAIDKSSNEPFIEMMEEEYFLIVKLGKNVTEYEEVISLSTHFEYCYLNDLEINFPIGSIILKENLFDVSLSEDYFFNKLNKPIENEKLFIKPSGKYISIIHKGSYEDVEYSIRILLDFIEENGIVIIGNCYCTDLLTYSISKTGEGYVKISIEIE